MVHDFDVNSSSFFRFDVAKVSDVADVVARTAVTTLETVNRQYPVLGVIKTENNYEAR